MKKINLATGTFEVKRKPQKKGDGAGESEVGRTTIDVSGGKHSYTFDYAIPQR